jgi:hypothetical protein
METAAIVLAVILVRADGREAVMIGGSQRRVSVRPADNPPAEMEQAMLILGLILLLIGIFAHVSILTTIGLIILVVGAVFWILGSVGRPVGGRRYWY